MPKEKGAEQMQDAKKAPLTAEQKQKRIIVICAIIALAAIAVGAVVWLVTALQNNGEVDYLKDDLSKYVYISEQDYKNFSVDISIRTPDESDVAEAIMKLVAAERTLVGIYAELFGADRGDDSVNDSKQRSCHHCNQL